MQTTRGTQMLQLANPNTRRSTTLEELYSEFLHANTVFHPKLKRLVIKYACREIPNTLVWVHTIEPKIPKTTPVKIPKPKLALNSKLKPHTLKAYSNFSNRIKREHGVLIDETQRLQIQQSLANNPITQYIVDTHGQLPSLLTGPSIDHVSLLHTSKNNSVDNLVPAFVFENFGKQGMTVQEWNTVVENIGSVLEDCSEIPYTPV